MHEFDSRKRQGLFFFSQPHQDQICGPPSVLSNGYQWFFPREQTGLGVKLTTHLHLVLRLGKCGVVPPFTHTSSRSGD